jgi:hypothetical protein
MEGEIPENWNDLCAQVAKEQDPDRLMELVTQINQLLEDKERRLQRKKADEHETEAAD